MLISTNVLNLSLLTLLLHSHLILAQVAKVRSYEAVGIGTPAALYFAEPLMQSLNTKIISTKQNSGEPGYSIMYKSLRTTGESTIFPCIPSIFTLRIGADFRIRNKVSGASLEPSLTKLWYGGFFIGYENTFRTGFDWLVITFSSDFILYRYAKTYTDLEDKLNYIGISFLGGINCFVGSKSMLAVEMSLYAGYRNYIRRGYASEYNNQIENGVVLGIGLPHFFSLHYYYLFRENHRKF